MPSLGMLGANLTLCSPPLYCPQVLEKKIFQEEGNDAYLPLELLGQPASGWNGQGILLIKVRVLTNTCGWVNLLLK